MVVLVHRVSPQSSAAVNPANGNLKLTAQDSTAVQGHGRLGYVLRRSYNSQEPTAATLPGSLGAGWALNLGHTDDLAGAGVPAPGSSCPGSATPSPSSPTRCRSRWSTGTAPVTSSPPRFGVPAVPVGALECGLAALTPTVLRPPTGRTVCVDLAYRAPAGVPWAVALPGRRRRVRADQRELEPGRARLRSGPPGPAPDRVRRHRPAAQHDRRLRQRAALRPTRAAPTESRRRFTSRARPAPLRPS